jgi:hypothetical protein
MGDLVEFCVDRDDDWPIRPHLDETDQQGHCRGPEDESSRSRTGIVSLKSHQNELGSAVLQSNTA